MDARTIRLHTAVYVILLAVLVEYQGELVAILLTTGIYLAAEYLGSDDDPQ